MTQEKDTLFAARLSSVGNFTFDRDVVLVFPDMIKRSVPGYGSILSLLGEISDTYVQPGTNVYDLGCSLGACTFAVADRLPDDCVIHAVDNSPAMMDRFCQAAEQHPRKHSIRAMESDLTRVPIENASLVILNFTLQFVPVEQRTALMQRITAGTNPSGALVLSEKILFDDPEQDQLLRDLHHAFKRSNGYSELEIAQKRTALEDTLVRESLGDHLGRLTAAGYRTVAPWLQCFNFVSILAIK
jgi:tRNA (cmo5U34)-methyltransferase